MRHTDKLLLGQKRQDKPLPAAGFARVTAASTERPVKRVIADSMIPSDAFEKCCTAVRNLNWYLRTRYILPDAILDASAA